MANIREEMLFVIIKFGFLQIGVLKYPQKFTLPHTAIPQRKHDAWNQANPMTFANTRILWPVPRLLPRWSSAHPARYLFCFYPREFNFKNIEP
jgi:hypothetical protein